MGSDFRAHSVRTWVEKCFLLSPKDAKTFFIRVFLATLLVTLAARLVGFLILFGENSLQADFSAFYTAGEALNSGLSPYRNYVAHQPPIWDGVDGFKHSRFLYPPLAANFFQMFAMLPYHLAKYLWMLFGLGCLFFSMSISVKCVIPPNRRSPDVLFTIGIFVLLYYPLLTFLERGQTDALTLLFLIIAAEAIASRRRRILAGILLAVATLFKLHVVFLLPFLVLRRQWRIVAGYAVGVSIILVLTVALNGHQSFMAYIFEEMPRISAYGEGGTADMRLPPGSTQIALKDVPAGFTRKDGRQYVSFFFPFVSNATLARTKVSAFLRAVGEYLGLDINSSMLSMLFFTLFVGAVFLWEVFDRPGFEKVEPFTVFVYWQIVLVGILLCAPLTWAMNTIWLLPVFVVFIHQYPLVQNRTQAFFLYMVLLGLTAAAIPDHRGFTMLVPFFSRVLKYKYVVAELLALVGLSGILLGIVSNKFSEVQAGLRSEDAISLP